MDITKTQIGIGIASFAGLAVATSLMVSNPNPVADIPSTQTKIEDYIQPIPVEEYNLPADEIQEYLPAKPIIDETISKPKKESKVKRAKPKQKVAKKATPKRKIAHAQKKSKKVYKSYRKSRKQKYMTWVELNNLKQTSIFPEGYKAEFSRRD